MMENQFCQNTRILMLILLTHLSREATRRFQQDCRKNCLEYSARRHGYYVLSLELCLLGTQVYRIFQYDKCDTFKRCTSFCSYLSVRLRVLLWNRFKMLVLNIMLNLYSNLQSFLQSSLQLSSRAGVIEQKKYIKPSEVT